MTIDTTDQQAVTVAQELGETTPGFLIDLASRIHAKATPAMGFDGYDVDRLIEIARSLASVSSASAETLALQAIKVVTATAKDGAAGLSRIMAIANAADVRASYSDLLQDPAVALIVEHPRTEWAHLFKPDATGCAIPPEGWQCSRARGHTGPCAASPEPVPATNQAGEVETARHYLGKHTLGFVLTNDERQEIARIMASFAATQPTTGQESDARAIIQNLLKAIPLYWAMSETDKSAVRAARSFVATQPATSQEGEIFRLAANLVYRIEAAGALEHEGSNFERWKTTARSLAPSLRAALATQTATSSMKMAVDRDWLAAKIAADPDAECEAGVLHPEATQPATSQEGEGDRYREALRVICEEELTRTEMMQIAEFAISKNPEEAWMTDSRSLDAGLPETSQEGEAELECEYDEDGSYALIWKNGYAITAFPNGKVIITKTPCEPGWMPIGCDVSALAATPTPPTLSEDLREALERNIPVGTIDARTRDAIIVNVLRAALAQVKAS